MKGCRWFDIWVQWLPGCTEKASGGASPWCAVYVWTEGNGGLAVSQGRQYSGNNSSKDEEERWHQWQNKVIIRFE